MKRARETDTSKLNANIASFAPLDPDYDIIQPPFPMDKEGRGMKHEWIREMLCPIDKREILSSDRFVARYHFQYWS